MRLTRISLRSLLLCLASLLASSLACAQPAGVVGILEGGATLIRQTTRYALAEGVALNEQDIIETAPGAFVQIELPAGVLVGVGRGHHFHDGSEAQNDHHVVDSLAEDAATDPAGRVPTLAGSIRLESTQTAHAGERRR